MRKGFPCHDFVMRIMSLTSSAMPVLWWICGAMLRALSVIGGRPENCCPCVTTASLMASYPWMATMALKFKIMSCGDCYIPVSKYHLFLYLALSMGVLLDWIVRKRYFYVHSTKCAHHLNFILSSMTWSEKIFPYFPILFSTYWMVLCFQDIGSFTIYTRENGAIIDRNGSPLAASMEIWCDIL